jgi:hypothetical protein
LLTGSSPWPVWSSRWTRRCDWWIYRVFIKILFYMTTSNENKWEISIAVNYLKA